jgi:hypothetical protein
MPTRTSVPPLLRILKVSLLVQVGLLDPSKLPVKGQEQAKSLLELLQQANNNNNNNTNDTNGI